MKLIVKETSRALCCPFKNLHDSTTLVYLSYLNKVCIEQWTWMYILYCVNKTQPKIKIEILLYAMCEISCWLNSWSREGWAMVSSRQNWLIAWNLSLICCETKILCWCPEHKISFHLKLQGLAEVSPGVWTGLADSMDHYLSCHWYVGKPRFGVGIKGGVEDQDLVPVSKTQNIISPQAEVSPGIGW